MSSDLERKRTAAWVTAMERLDALASPPRADAEFYCEIFNQVPTPIWIEDWSRLRADLENRGLSGRPDLEQMLQSDFDLVGEIYENVVQIDLNDAALVFFSETSKQELIKRLHENPPVGSMSSSAIMIAALDRGEVSYSWINQCEPYPDGEPRWLKETFFVPPAYRQSWERVIYTVQDVTDLKLAQRNLERARLEADAANNAKSEFLANVSHELRTPLHAIAGFSELLVDEKLGPLGHDAYREYARFIRDSGDHLLDLITDILDLSQYEAGELALREEEMELHETIDGAVRLVSERAENLAIDLQWQLATPNVSLLADERKIKQILVNLLDNAVKFTGSGGRILLRGESGEGGSYVITVEDSGVGIKRSDIPRVLERFGQTGDARDQGTGLGLPLARALAELHGGSLTLTSKPGVGTRVTVKLPASRVIRVGDRLQVDSAR